MIISLKLDVTKLDKSAFFKGTKGTYCDLTIFINDEPDQFGNNCSAKQDLGKERREEKLYVGNGKIVSGGNPSPPPARKQAQPPRRQSTPGHVPPDQDDSEFGEIPF